MSKFRTRFSERKRVALEFDPEESMVKGSFKDECDVNKIMAKYRRTGQLPDLVKSDPQFGDFSTVPTYLEAMTVVRRSTEQFEALPAAVRAECGNNPEVFLDRLRDPEWTKKHRLALPPSPASSAAGQAAPSPSADLEDLAGASPDGAPDGGASTAPKPSVRVKK